jgi:hypothetical protein
MGDLFETTNQTKRKGLTPSTETFQTFTLPGPLRYSTFVVVGSYKFLCNVA